MKVILKIILPVFMLITASSSASAAGAVQRITAVMEKIHVSSSDPAVTIGKYVTVATPAVSLPAGVSEAILKPSSAMFNYSGYNAWRDYEQPRYTNFYYVYGYRDSTGDHWVKAGETPKIKSGQQLLVSFWTDSNQWPPGITASANLANLYREDTNAQVGSLYMSLNPFNISVTPCSLRSSNNNVVRWPNISPSDIASGSVPQMQTSILYNCTITTRISIKVDSVNGIYDSQNGVIKTDLPGLGIKLSWADNAAHQLPVGTVDNITVDPGDKNFSVLAKPVQLGSTPIGGGSFSSTATITFEYD